MTGEQIEEIYNLRFRGPFPYDDCRRLASVAELPMEDLVPGLDMYFSNIAGYSSSASRLHARPDGDLKKAKESLALGFFEVYPSLERCRELMTSELTPELLEQMQVAEQLRLALLKLLGSTNEG